MSRLIDDLRAQRRLTQPWFVAPENEPAWEKDGRQLWKFLSNSQLPVLKIDNVAEYYYVGTDQEQWNLEKHFPNLAPVFPVAWFEHKIPKRIHSKECGDSDMSEVLGSKARAGFL